MTSQLDNWIKGQISGNICTKPKVEAGPTSTTTTAPSYRWHVKNNYFLEGAKKIGTPIKKITVNECKEKCEVDKQKMQ